MGGFFILLSSPEGPLEANGLFCSALNTAKAVPGQAPNEIFKSSDSQVASFARLNGSGTAVVSNPSTGNWLVTAGTWFHADGYSTGQESRLLDDYAKNGVRHLANRLEGFFAIAIGDANAEAAYVITDLVGSCHCFLRYVRGGTTISTSSLLLAAVEAYQLDRIACQEFLATGVIYEDRSLFQEVRKLAPASIFRFSRGSLQSAERYWRISDVEPESIAGPKAAPALWSALTESAGKVSNAFQRPLCDLTGGYDSRVVVAAFAEAHLPITTIVTGPENSRDVVISKALAQKAGLPHLHVQKHRQLTFGQIHEALALTDGEYDLIEYARILGVHQPLSECFDISINGSFGEIARGYWWELLAPDTGKCMPLPAVRVAARRYAVGAYDRSLFAGGNRLELVDHLRGAVERAIDSLTAKPNCLQMDQVYLMLRMQRWQGRIASSTNRIWPCLSPFMFRSVLELMLAVQTNVRKRSRLVRRMLAQNSPSWASIPLEDGAPCVPLTWTNAIRFTPRLSFYGRRALQLAARVAGRTHGGTGSTEGDVQRSQLWSGEDVRTILHPRTMRLASIIDSKAMGSFLQRSQQKGFAFGAQWNRLLTLECALRAIEEVRNRKN
jgi:hypothetical protein